MHKTMVEFKFIERYWRCYSNCALLVANRLIPCLMNQLFWLLHIWIKLASRINLRHLVTFPKDKNNTLHTFRSFVRIWLKLFKLVACNNNFLYLLEQTQTHGYYLLFIDKIKLTKLKNAITFLFRIIFVK